MQLFQVSEGTAAQRRLFFHAVDATDGITAETGLSGAGRISKNGAATAASAANITEIDSTNMPGRYYIEFGSSELDTVGIIEFRFKTAACAEVVARAQVVPWDPYDAVRAGLTALPNANAEAAGGLYTRGSGAGQINQNANGQVDSRTVAMAADVVTAAAVANGAIDAATFAAGAIDATAIAADAIGSSELAAAAANKIRDTILSDATAFAGANIALIKAKTDNLPTDPADQSLIIAATDAIMTRLGAPAGASVSADIAAIEAQTDDIGVAGAGLTALGDARLANLDAAVTTRAVAGDAMALTVAERASVADKLLGRARAGGADGGRTVAECLAFGRNKWEISGGVLTVYDDDDLTPLYTAAVTTAAGDPVTSVDPV